MHQAVEGNGMKCPKCKNDFPRGGSFCPHCRFEPTKRHRLMLSFLIATPLMITIMTWLLILAVDEKNWQNLISGGLALGLLVMLSVQNYRWLRWTRPSDSDKAAASDSS